VIADPARVEELLPDALRKAEVRRAVAVQMADLLAADPKAELAAPARPGLDTRPGCDLRRDLLV
jgi:hypothetical protein